MNGRVLVIDDNEDIHMDFKKILCDGDVMKSSIDEEASLLFGKDIPATGNQFTLQNAFQGQEGLELVKQAKASGEPIAVAFVDMRMPPGWDGLTTITHLWEEDPRLEVVICTAYSDRSWDEIMSTLGPTDRLLILKKPFDIVEVLQMTTTLVEKWNLTRMIEARMAAQTQQLADVETQLRMAFETSMIGMALVTLDGKFLKVNESVCKMLECSEDELLQGEFASFFHPEVLSQECERMTSLAEGEATSYSVETRFETKIGETIWVQLDMSRVAQSEGLSAYLVAQVQDITDRLKAEQLAQRAQRLESIGQLASGIAHDLNNCLAPVSMSMRTLRLEYERSSALIDAVESSVDRGTDLLKQLLTFAKGADGERVPVSIKEVIDELVKMLESTFSKRIQIAVSLEADLPSVIGDKTQLYQVLLNLCVNARDAMPDGGSLNIDAKRCLVDLENFSAIGEAQPGTYLRVCVEDSGQGISENDIDRVFEPYFTTKGPDKGNGLGLATSMGIVKGYGGFIQVNSKVAEGTSVAVYLPACNRAPENKASPKGKPSAPFRGGGETVLLVDDEPDVLKTMSDVLTSWDLKTVIAMDGEQALNIIHELGDHIGLIITDIQMPKMDGEELIRVLRRSMPETPVIVVSGEIDSQRADMLKHLGVQAQLEKPFSQEALERALSEVIHSRREASEQQKGTATNAPEIEPGKQD